MGAANSACKLTVDCITMLELLEPNAVEVRNKNEMREQVQQLLALEWPTCRVLPFGSSESGFGFGGCDLDLGIYFEEMDVDCQGQFSPHERIQILSTAVSRLSGTFTVKQFIRNARVPIIKLWDATRKIACDICVGQVNVLLNTALLKYYGQLDPRVRPLIFAVKYWARQRGINDSANGTLSSYGFSLLAIFYLQIRQPQNLLPPVQALFQSIQSEKRLSSLLSRLCSLPVEMDSSFGRCTRDSIGASLAGFFQFYAVEFDLEDNVVSIRTGAPLSKATKWSHSVPWRLSIEDPFELNHDVGRVIFHKRGQHILQFEFQRAYEMVLADYRLDQICERDQSSWNMSATCHLCSGDEHTARDCYLMAHRMDSQKLTESTMTLNTVTALADCWYCGDVGHFKAACPLIVFRGPALQADTAVQAVSSPIPVLGSMRRKTSLPNNSRSEMSFASPIISPMRPPRKKKKSRHGSPISSPVNPSPSSHLKQKPLQHDFALAQSPSRMWSKKCASRQQRLDPARVVCLT